MGCKDIWRSQTDLFNSILKHSSPLLCAVQIRWYPLWWMSLVPGEAAPHEARGTVCVSLCTFEFLPCVFPHAWSDLRDHDTISRPRHFLSFNMSRSVQNPELSQALWQRHHIWFYYRQKYQKERSKDEPSLSLWDKYDMREWIVLNGESLKHTCQPWALQNSEDLKLQWHSTKIWDSNTGIPPFWGQVTK